MDAHTRALIAASAYTVIIGQKVAGLYDHAAGQQLRIATELRGNVLQVADGERSVMFGGTLPELYDEANKAFVSLEVDGTRAHGYDRGAQGHYVADVTDRLIQLFDYSQDAWFAYEVLAFEDGAPI